MNKNKFKKLLIIPLLLLNLLFYNVVNVDAASFSVSKSKSTVNPGGSFTVSVKASGAGQFSVSVSNGSASSNSLWVDGSGSFSVTAGQSGTTTVTVTAVDATGYDETPITGSKSISVSIKSPSGGSSGGNSGGGTQTTTPPPVEDTRSKDNNLASLSISQGTLSPQFNASKTTYKVDLTSDVTSIEINAKAKDSKAKVSGVGKKELKIGENNFVITVHAENGAKKTYTVSVYVTEKPKIFVNIGEKRLGILNDFSKLNTPDGYDKTTIQIDGNEVSALKGEKNGLTLVYLQNEENINKLYIYNEDGSVYEYKTLIVDDNEYVVIQQPEKLDDVSNLNETKVKIGDLELDGWSYDDEALQNYNIVYLMNSDGKAQLYSYEATEGTLQIYTPATESNSLNTLTYVFIGTTVVAGVVAIAGFVMYFNFKKKSISAIKDYYKKKNQG